MNVWRDLTNRKRARALTAAPSEQAIQKQILDYLRFRKILAWKNPSVGVYVRARNTYIPSTNRGSADILGILPGGRLIAVEVKKSSGRLSSHQELWLDQVRAAGALTVVARSVEDVERALQGVI